MTYFSHSNYGQHQLKAELEKEKDKWGIQASGATRFSTFSTHAKSIAWCFNAIEHCLISGTIKFDTKAVSCLCYRKVDTNRLKQKPGQSHSHFGYNCTTLIYYLHPSIRVFKHSKGRIPPVLMYFLYLLASLLDLPMSSKIQVHSLFSIS